MREELTAAVKAIANSFEPGELPYLALTSKPEHAIRDRLAWLLSKDGFCVAREWRERCDLAVLDDQGEPLMVLEAKASYTHDVAWSMSRATHVLLQTHVGGVRALESMIRSDADKVLRLRGRGEGFLLLVAMHRGDSAPRHLLELISEGHRSTADQDVAERQLVSYIGPLGPVSEPIPLGSSMPFGIRMTVTAWLCGPVYAKERWHQAGRIEALG